MSYMSALATAGISTEEMATHLAAYPGIGFDEALREITAHQEDKAMRCSRCLDEVFITTPHEQFLFGASGLCPECREKVFEESYRDQTELRCCRNCGSCDTADDWIVCGHNGRPVSTTGICERFEHD